MQKEISVFGEVEEPRVGSFGIRSREEPHDQIIISRSRISRLLQPAFQSAQGINISRCIDTARRKLGKVIPSARHLSRDGMKGEMQIDHGNVAESKAHFLSRSKRRLKLLVVLVRSVTQLKACGPQTYGKITGESRVAGIVSHAGR